MMKVLNQSIAAIICCALVSVLVLYPLPIHLKTHLPAYFDSMNKPISGDPMLFCWNLWWVGGWMNGEHDLLDCMFLNYPFGVNLAHHTLSVSNGILAAPMLKSMNLISVHNGLLIFHNLLTSVSMFGLGLTAGFSPFGAFITALIALLWPARVMHQCAHLNVAGVGWLGLSFWLLYLVFHSRRLFWILPCAAVVGLAALSGWYQILTLIMCSWSMLNWGSPKKIGSQLVKLVVIFTLAILFLLPMILPMLQNRESIPVRSTEEKVQYSITPAGLLTIPHMNYIRSAVCNETTYSVNNLETVGYLGIVTSFLLIIALWKKPSLCGPWIIGMVWITVLSFGPTIQLGYLNFPGPYRLLDLVPGLAAGRTPGRFFIGAGFLAAMSIGSLVSSLNWTRIKDKAMMLAVTLLLLLDYWPAPLPIIKPATPGYLDMLRNLNCQECSVFDIPASAETREYQYYQTFHGKPITGGFTARVPQDYYRRLEELPLMKAIADPSTAAKSLLSAKPELVADLLHIFKAPIVIFHKQAMGIVGTHVLPEIRLKIPGDLFYSDENSQVLRNIPGQDFWGDNPRWYFLNGWYGREIWDNVEYPVRWSRGLNPSVTFFAPEECDTLSCRFNIISAQQVSNQDQCVGVKVKGEKLTEFVISHPFKWVSKQFVIHGPFDPAGNKIEFECSSETIQTPLNSGGNTDFRPLSIAINGLILKKD